MQDKINSLGNEIIDLIEKYQDQLPSYEVGHQLIMNATSMMLCCAPDELTGIKTVLACVDSGIVNYEKTHS